MDDIKAIMIPEQKENKAGTCSQIQGASDSGKDHSQRLMF